MGDLHWPDLWASPTDHAPDTDRRWHLDGVFVPIAGRRMYQWRAVDDEGEALDVLGQSRRDKGSPVVCDSPVAQDVHRKTLPAVTSQGHGRT
jgi:DDE superfamily endonuclease